MCAMSVKGCAEVAGQVAVGATMAALFGLWSAGTANARPVDGPVSQPAPTGSGTPAGRTDAQRVAEPKSSNEEVHSAKVYAAKAQQNAAKSSDKDDGEQKAKSTDKKGDDSKQSKGSGGRSSGELESSKEEKQSTKAQQNAAKSSDDKLSDDQLRRKALSTQQKEKTQASAKGVGTTVKPTSATQFSPYTPKISDAVGTKLERLDRSQKLSNTAGGGGVAVSDQLGEARRTAVKPDREKKAAEPPGGTGAGLLSSPILSQQGGDASTKKANTGSGSTGWQSPLAKEIRDAYDGTAPTSGTQPKPLTCVVAVAGPSCLPTIDFGGSSGRTSAPELKTSDGRSPSAGSILERHTDSPAPAASPKPVVGKLQPPVQPEPRTQVQQNSEGEGGKKGKGEGGKKGEGEGGEKGKGTTPGKGNGKPAPKPKENPEPADSAATGKDTRSARGAGSSDPERNPKPGDPCKSPKEINPCKKAAGKKSGADAAKPDSENVHMSENSPAYDSSAPGAVESRAPELARAASNRALFEQYRNILRREMTKPYVVDSQLRGWMDTMWRPGAKIGNGSTAAAARFEKMTGQQVGGVWHSGKARGFLTRLEKWIADPRNAEATPGDRAAVENVIRDLRDALEGN